MRSLTLFLCVALLSLSAKAEEADWGFVTMVTYGPRAIDGTIFVNRPGPISGGATADSLNLGLSQSFLYAVGFRFKRWNFMLDSMPTSFSGDGFATIGIDLPNGDVISTTTEMSSNIDVDLLLANVMFDVFNDHKGKFQVGVGLGQTNIDIHLDPTLEFIPGVDVDGKTPFGFLAFSYARHFGKFSITAAAQGVSIAVDSSSMKYSNLNLMGGYMFFKKKWYSEVVFGYRRVGFEFHYDNANGISDTDVVLTGPYVGLVGGF